MILLRMTSHDRIQRASLVPSPEVLTQPEFSDIYSTADRTVKMESSPSPSICAALMASVVTKRASAKAFKIHKRSMTSPQVMNQIGIAFDELYGDDDC
jgi:hypothetical protein